MNHVGKKWSWVDYDINDQWIHFHWMLSLLLEYDINNLVVLLCVSEIFWSSLVSWSDINGGPLVVMKDDDVGLVLAVYLDSFTESVLKDWPSYGNLMAFSLWGFRVWSTLITNFAAGTNIVSRDLADHDLFLGFLLPITTWFELQLTLYSILILIIVPMRRLLCICWDLNNPDALSHPM